MRKHKIKKERPEGSSGHRGKKQNDLAYCIHDRVELLHQVFSLLKPKEIKAMAPDCVRDISLDDLQELCLEELLGISSKRLLSALDGAPPPSDTESSSDDSEGRRGSHNFDTISLDSISSDEGALSNGQESEKTKKHKQCRRRDKRKRSSKSKAGAATGGERERAAERAGLTVLELLELQARARAIRAQLNAEIERKNAAAAVVTSVVSASDDEVEIKEEPPEVVELVSSDEEAKPDLAKLEATVSERSVAPTQLDPAPTAAEVNQTENATHIVTKRADLTIIVPKTASSRKIKLNRQKSVSVTATSDASATNKTVAATGNTEVSASTRSITASQNIIEVEPETRNAKTTRRITVIKEDPPKKKDRVKKSKKAKRAKDADGSDHDEITLQLSDSEKMDLLENFDRKTYEQVSSSSEDDSEDSGDEADEPGSPTHTVVAADCGNHVSQDNNENITVTDNNVGNNTVAHKSSEDSSVPLDNIDKGSAQSDHQTAIVDTEQRNEETLPVENATSPNINDTNENCDEEKTIHEEKDTEKTAKEVEEKSTGTGENSTDVKKLIENTAKDQQIPDDATENNVNITVEDENKVEPSSEKGSTVTEDKNKSDATKVNIQEVALPETVEDPASKIDTVAKEIDTSDAEITKKSKSKKKSNKKEKKQKKSKKSKD